VPETVTQGFSQSSHTKCVGSMSSAGATTPAHSVPQIPTALSPKELKKKPSFEKYFLLPICMGTITIVSVKL